MSFYAKVGSQAIGTGATGTQDFTWSTGDNWPVNATPVLVRVWGTYQTVDGTTTNSYSFEGWAASTTQRWCFISGTDGTTAANSGQLARNNALIVHLTNANPTTNGVADFSAFLQNGFRINRTTAFTSAFVVNYMAFAGTDMQNFVVGQTTIPTTAGATQQINCGFVPDWGILLAAHSTINNTAAISRTLLGMIANYQSTISQAAALYHDNDAAASMQSAVGFRADRAVVTSVSANANSVTAPLATGSFIATPVQGAQLVWAGNATTGTPALLYVFVKGPTARILTSVQPANGTETLTYGFQPKAAIAIGTGQTADGTIATGIPHLNTAGFFTGGSDGTTEAAIGVLNEDADADVQARRILDRTKFLSYYEITTSGSGAQTAVIAKAGEVDATFTATGINAVWASSDAAGRRTAILALGEPVAGGDATLSAAVATATATAPNATLATASSFAAQAAAATATVPNASIAAASTLAAVAATATAASPDATLSAAGTATLSAQVADATASSPNGTLAASSVIAGTTAPASASSPSAVLTASSVLAGAVTAATTTSPSATLSAASAVTKVVRMTLRTRNRSLTLLTRARRP